MLLLNKPFSVLLLNAGNLHSRVGHQLDGTITKLHMTQSDDNIVISPGKLVRLGMDRFKDGDIDGSIALFDKADKSVLDGSLKPYLWQRGISYYYADKFQEGSDQVRRMLICSYIIARIFLFFAFEKCIL